MTGLEIALERIAENKKTQNPELILEGLGLTSLPDELFELTHLKSLILGPYYNEKKGWINSGNYNKLRQGDIDKLQSLSALQTLDLSENQLTSLSLPKNLPALQSLNLSWNQLTSLSLPENLPALQTLDLSYNQLTSLSLPENLPALQTLDLSENQLTSLSLPKNLPALQSLNLSWNQIKDFSFLENLPALQSLDLYNNQLTSLSLPENLPALQTLNLSGNHLTNSHLIRSIVSNFPYLQLLYLYNNPLEGINESLLGRDQEDNCLENLKSHFLSLEKGRSYNNEVKMILLGNSTAGKTTLSKRLEGKEPDKAESSTHGIRQVNFTFPYKHEHFKEVLINLWDFGGQEYYHATHRLFFGYRTVYLVLWEIDTNKQGTHLTRIKIEGKEAEIELEHFPYSYWIDNIEYLTGNKHLASHEKIPILLVQNKIDKDKEFRAYQQEELDRVKETCPISANLPKNLEMLQDLIGECLKDLKNVIGYEIGKYWEIIRTKIRESKEPFLSYKQYRELCLSEDYRMEETESKILCQFLNDSGVILHYPESDKLKDYVFIKPTWVTDTIYEILSRDIIDKKGEFSFEHVVEKTKDSGIDASLWVELLVKFELIFRKPGESNVFVAPQYLPDTCESENLLQKLTKNYRMGFYLHYPKFLPKSTIQRIVRYYGNQSNDVYWKNGIQFEVGGIGAFVYCEWESKKIIVKVENEQILPQIWNTFERINDGNEEVDISIDDKKYLLIKFCKENEEMTYKKYWFIFGNIDSNLAEKLEAIINNIRAGETKEALDNLLKVNKSSLLESNISVSINNICSNYDNLRKEKLVGTIKDEDYRFEINRIHTTIQEIIKEIRKTQFSV